MVVDTEMKVKCVENKCGNIYDAVAVVERYEALYEGKQEGCKTNVRGTATEWHKEPTTNNDYTSDKERASYKQR